MEKVTLNTKTQPTVYRQPLRFNLDGLDATLLEGGRTLEVQVPEMPPEALRAIDNAAETLGGDDRALREALQMSLFGAAQTTLVSRMFAARII